MDKITMEVAEGRVNFSPGPSGLGKPHFLQGLHFWAKTNRQGL
jgi:ABC-type ATPase involved in cell division